MHVVLSPARPPRLLVLVQTRRRWAHPLAACCGCSSPRYGVAPAPFLHSQFQNRSAFWGKRERRREEGGRKEGGGLRASQISAGSCDGGTCVSLSFDVAGPPMLSRWITYVMYIDAASCVAPASRQKSGRMQLRPESLISPHLVDTKADIMSRMSV